MLTLNQFIRSHYAWFTQATESSGFDNDDLVSMVHVSLAEAAGDRTLPLEQWQSLTTAAVREARKKLSRARWDEKRFQGLDYVGDDGRTTESIALARASQEAFQETEAQLGARSSADAMASSLHAHLDRITDERERLAVLLLFQEELYGLVAADIRVAETLRAGLTSVRSRAKRLADSSRAAELEQQAEDLYADLQAAEAVAARSNLDITKPAEVARLLGIDVARLDTFRRRVAAAAPLHSKKNPSATWLRFSPAQRGRGTRAAPSTRRAAGAATSRRGR